MKYLSVCAGIEAASVAWHHMGWEPVAFSEIEKFPSAVLAHHYPNVPNWGDMTKFKEWPDANIDVLVGGTPCQSFSVAGLRKGLDDPRGNLMLTFGSIAQRYRPEWLVWENVPGVLSSNGGRDFGSFLGMLAELGYGFAYRVLDAQFHGVAQRRRRVFVVGYLGDWHRAAAVLFERHSLSGHPAPSRQARKGIAGGIEDGTRGCWWDGGQLSQTLDAVLSKGQAMPEKNRFPAVLQPRRLIPWTQCECCEDFWCNIHDAHAYDCVCPSIDEWETDPYGLQEQGPAAQPVAGTLGNRGLRSHTELDSSPCADRGMDVVAVAMRESGQGYWMQDEIAGTLRAEGEDRPSRPSHVIQQQAMQVRRLTPVECERLQGFPDGYTNIPWRGKPESPDGPRYKALGNSMAVPVMRWIGERINEVSKL